MSTLSGPTSRLITSRVCNAICSVRSMRVPAGARRCNWIWPVSTIGKNLGAERSADQDNNRPTDDEVGDHDDAPSFHHGACEPIVLGAQPIETRLARWVRRARTA